MHLQQEEQMIDYLALSSLPSVHPQTLVVKTRAQSGGALATAFWGGETVSPTGLTAGLEQLARLGEAGKIKQVDPIGPMPRAVQGPLAALHLLAQQSVDDAPE